MPRAASALLKLATSRKAGNDINLLKALQHEISYEQSVSSEQSQQSHRGSVGDFKLTWDTEHSRDIILQKKCESGNEVAVSALLGPESEYEAFTWDVLMKVCIKKPGLSSILQFDCEVYATDSSASNFNIQGAYYLPSLAPPTLSQYRGPDFSTLDPSLQEELKKYLETRGIGKSLTNFLLTHLHEKEKKQYLKWLEELHSYSGEQATEP